MKRRCDLLSRYQRYRVREPATSPRAFVNPVNYDRFVGPAIELISPSPVRGDRGCRLTRRFYRHLRVVRHGCRIASRSPSFPTSPIFPPRRLILPAAPVLGVLPVVLLSSFCRDIVVERVRLSTANSLSLFKRPATPDATKLKFETLAYLLSFVVLGSKNTWDVDEKQPARSIV